MSQVAMKPAHWLRVDAPFQDVLRHMATHKLTYGEVGHDETTAAMWAYSEAVAKICGSKRRFVDESDDTATKLTVVHQSTWGGTIVFRIV